MVEETPNEPVSESRATFIEHLKELRKRILYSGAAVIVGLIVGMITANGVLWLLELPAPAGMEWWAFTLTENVTTWFQVGLTTGFIIAMPFLIYQLFAFIGPGLTKREKRFIFSIIPAITIMFLLGVAFAYFVALPMMLNFLYSFNSDIAQLKPSISDYVNIVTRVLLFVGLIFETPLVIMGLAKLGLVSPKWLAARRKWWIFLSFVIAAVISPTMDIYSQTILAIPMILLMELGILLARFVYKKKREQPQAA
ncbi:MAG: twin-arginine translocase subunit TatC [Dehalococcoidia bacterium]|nr:twin-arginine translocase subunit TatC [Dehalococcoidia bacterium]